MLIIQELWVPHISIFLYFSLTNPIIPVLPAKLDFEALKTALLYFLTVNYCWWRWNVPATFRNTSIKAKTWHFHLMLLSIINCLLMHSGHTHEWHYCKDFFPSVYLLVVTYIQLNKTHWFPIHIFTEPSFYSGSYIAPLQPFYTFKSLV